MGGEWDAEDVASGYSISCGHVTLFGASGSFIGCLAHIPMSSFHS